MPRKVFPNAVPKEVMRYLVNIPKEDHGEFLSGYLYQDNLSFPIPVVPNLSNPVRVLPRSALPGHTLTPYDLGRNAAWLQHLESALQNTGYRLLNLPDYGYFYAEKITVPTNGNSYGAKIRPIIMPPSESSS